MKVEKNNYRHIKPTFLEERIPLRSWVFVVVVEVDAKQEIF